MAKCLEDEVDDEIKKEWVGARTASSNPLLVDLGFVVFALTIKRRLAV